MTWGKAREGEFGQLVAIFRHRRGLSQDELAKRSGMSVRAIGNLERSEVRRPRWVTVSLLADALALSGTERAVLTGAAAGLARNPEGTGDQGPTAPCVVPSQLPPDIQDFTGRPGELERLRTRMTNRRSGSGVPVIAGVTGKAGIGKTALAVHVGHQLRPMFPGGQLYVNLRGAGARALHPEQVLGQFLSALGVEGRCVPGDVESRAGLYRSLLASKQVLVVLDNAADEAQVRPLLPAGGRNVVLVTGRARLSGLTLTEVIDLGELSRDQSVELLTKITGTGRVAGEPVAAASVAARCGYLPLALRIAGARLAARPHWRVQQLADRLHCHHRRLDELTTGDLDVRASIALSYQSVGETEQRAFRMLGLLKAPDVSPWMLSALLGIPEMDAAEIAERLADAQLLDVAGADTAGQFRYQCHDLLWLFARERLAAEETPASQRAALERM